jgi:hypothetical protein
MALPEKLLQEFEVNYSLPWSCRSYIDLTYAPLQTWLFEYQVLVIGLGQG